MSQVANQTRWEVPQWLKELNFLTSFFSWFFLLLTRLSEPLMLLSTLYIIAETGVPALVSPALHTLAIGIMITAPELLLPGSFVVASKAQERGERQAGLLLAVCILFVALTLVTLISLFVWHFTGDALAWLMCARCATAVGYSILMRIMNHEHDQTNQQVVQQQEIEQRIEHLVNQFNTQLQVFQSEVVQVVESLVQSHLNEQSGQVQTMMQSELRQVKPLIAAGQSATVQEVHGLIQSLVTEQVQPLMTAHHATISEQWTSQLAQTVQQFQQELHSAIATVASSSKPVRELRTITPLVQPENEPASEPANIRVPRFIQEQMNQGHKPTLSEIVDACQCAKNTAIRYRRELLGTDEEGVA